MERKEVREVAVGRAGWDGGGDGEAEFGKRMTRTSGESTSRDVQAFWPLALSRHAAAAQREKSGRPDSRFPAWLMA